MWLRGVCHRTQGTCLPFFFGYKIYRLTGMGNTCLQRGDALVLDITQNGDSHRLNIYDTSAFSFASLCDRR